MNKKELTSVSVILGIVLAVVFGAANAYLGLRVGMTVSASIPAAVLAMGIMQGILRKKSTLESNMVQTIGSAGESLAAGAIFTIPVLFMWAAEGKSEAPGILEICLISLFGGFLGILFMVPLRQTLIVKEHGNLIYPEGTACAGVLKAGEKGGKRSGIVFAGLGLAAIYKFLAEGFRFFPSEIDLSSKRLKGAGGGIDVLPALLGVGYICGPKTSSLMFGGGVLAWLVLMPLIYFFGGNEIFYPGDVPVAELDTWGLWRNYIRYIGAGAVATAGIISLIKTMPLIIKTFVSGIKSFRKKGEDLPLWIVCAGILLIALAMWLLPVIPLNFWGVLIVILFGFFFATVSSRMVGLVGSSNNPISGMTIATLIIVAFLFKITGNEGIDSMIAAVVIGSVICIVTAMAGDTSQDLKTGYLVGASPMKQQIGELIGALVSALALGGILLLFGKAWGYGSEELPAVQATLMRMVVEGVMGENLPWTLILVGCGIAIVGEIVGISVLPFAVGMYLPIHLSAGILCGGLVRLLVEKRKMRQEEKRTACVDRGFLYASGMIAGEGLVGILLALLAIIPAGNGNSIADVINFGRFANFGKTGALIAFLVFILIFLLYIYKRDKNSEEEPSYNIDE
ncbi:MAG: oligopeptide transporter, OPT family [Lachnospiraceae bacterium]|nr:oligopeptide transporter, OPT family [Lachnospiraceae bacterium]